MLSGRLRAAKESQKNGNGFKNECTFHVHTHEYIVIVMAAYYWQHRI